MECSTLQAAAAVLTLALNLEEEECWSLFLRPWFPQEPIKEAGILEGRNGIKETCLQVG